MKNIPLIFLSALLLVSPPACRKTGSAETSQADTSEAFPKDAMEEVKKLPQADKRLSIWVRGNADSFPIDVFEMDTQKVQGIRTSKERYDIHVEDSGVAKTTIYRTPPATFIEDRGETRQVTVVEPLVKKGERRTRKNHISIIYGPMGWGREPSKIAWNWKSVAESGDDMAGYDARGPRIGWATTEQLQINSDGTSSSNPAVLIKGSKDFIRIVATNPKLQSP